MGDKLGVYVFASVCIAGAVALYISGAVADSFELVLLGCLVVFIKG
jgi:hypothetical protein